MIETRYGKWAQAGVPHLGWNCETVEDLEKPSQLCEMCEKETIRYVHHMSHAEHADLKVGCVCAEHMSGDYETPKKRQREVINEARRREKERLEAKDSILQFKKSFLAQWPTSKKGNEYFKLHADHFVIFKSPYGFGAIWSKKDGTQTKAYAPSVDALKKKMLNTFFDFGETA